MGWCMLEPAGAHTSNNSSVDGVVAIVVVVVGAETAGSSWNNAVSVPVGVVGDASVVVVVVGGGAPIY